MKYVTVHKNEEQTGDNPIHFHVMYIYKFYSIFVVPGSHSHEPSVPCSTVLHHHTVSYVPDGYLGHWQSRLSVFWYVASEIISFWK